MKTYKILGILTALLTLLVFNQATIAATSALPPPSEEQSTQLIQQAFHTSVVYPQERGEFQFGFMPTYEHGLEGDTSIFPVSLEYGLTDSWQVEVEFEAYKINQPIDAPQTSGYGDTGIGTQYSFMHVDSSEYSFALGFETQFPTGSIKKDLTEGFQEYTPYFIAAKDFPDLGGSQLSVQTGFTFLQTVKTPSREEEEEENISGNPAATEFLLNVLYVIPYKTARFVAELNWTTSKWSDGQENQLYATPGIIFHLQRVEFGLGVPIGLNSSSDHYQIIGTFNYEI